MKIRTCTKCGKRSEEHVFAKFRHRDGRVGRRNVCLECRAAYQIENYKRLKEYRKNYNAAKRSEKRQKDFDRRKNIKRIVDEIKEKAVCSDCGGKFPPVAMDFDHIGHKNKSVASMVSQAYKIDLILEEIKQCEIVCACCHRVRTAKRKENLSPKQQCILVDPEGR